MDERMCCGTCKYNRAERTNTGNIFYCGCIGGDYFGADTAYDDTCDSYEQKEDKQ